MSSNYTNDFWQVKSHIRDTCPPQAEHLRNPKCGRKNTGVNNQMCIIAF